MMIFDRFIRKQANPYISNYKIKIRNIIIIIALISLTLSALWSCYPKPVGSTGPDGRRQTWAEMNLEQRKAHMKNQAVPRAGAVFRTWGPERFVKVDCTLCHGMGAKAGNFDMPTAHLPGLSGELLLGPELEKHPDTTRLKLDRLVPEMAEILGLKTFSLITRSWFGCYSCHLGPTGPMFGN